jgi:hypothetical protein
MREFADTCVHEDFTDADVFVGFIRHTDADSADGEPLDELPDNYSGSNAFNFEDVCPWFDHAAHALDPEYPAVQSQPALNPIISIVNRRRLPGRLPAVEELIEIPCEYQALRRNGDVEWLPSSASQLLDDDSARNCLVTFELRYPHDTLRPCNSIEDYPEDDGYESPDEYPLALHERLVER